MEELLRVDLDRWTNEIPVTRAHYEKFGAKLPAGLREELAKLEQRLASAGATA